MPSKELLAELKTILAEEYGLDLPDGEIEAFGNCLIDCFKILSESEDGK